MNCFMCKGDLEEKKVNYVVDLENTIIVAFYVKLW